MSESLDQFDVVLLNLGDASIPGNGLVQGITERNGGHNEERSCKNDSCAYRNVD
jgi:hypothetical protein